MLYSGVAVHAAALAHRWLVLARPPFADKQDNISFMALGIVLAYLFLFRKGVKDLGVTVLPLVAALMLAAAGHRQVNTISPFMDSPWFYLHVIFYFSSYAFFGVSACLGVHYVKDGDLHYERRQHLGAICGWILLSFALLAGSIWFYMAYGTYWLWTSKELWITATWLYYGLYLHARLIKGLRGRPAAVMGVLGFAVALFTYFGVGTVIKSPPSQF